jgi:quinol monooxygenase YgiN
MILVISRLRVRPEKRDEFLSAAQAALAPTRAEAGNMGYDISESLSEPNFFVVMERWKTHADSRSHLQSSHAQELLRVMAQCAAEMPRIEAITPARVEMLS